MPRLLHHDVSRQARVRPNCAAVIAGTDALSYAELDARSSQFAYMLRTAGCRAGDRVALLMPKEPNAIVALVGIYKAGGIYVPLDPASPVERLRKILEACGCRWLATSARAIPQIRELASAEPAASRRIAWCDSAPPPAADVAFTLADVYGAPATTPVPQSTPDDPAHILFTSGSTGTPKGVVITHANVVHFIDWAVRYFAMGPDDRVSAHPPLHFDLSFFDLFGAFAAGASVHLVPAALSVLPGRLADFIRERELTQWFSVPSVLAYLAQLDAVRHGDFPSLKRVLWCGDVLATPVLQNWMARVPHATYTNLYGPTETTIASSYYRVPARPEDPRADVPIGVACDGEELLVLDEALQPVAPGAVGILYISGVGLAPGYWGDGRETEAAFRPHPTRAGQRLYRTGDLARIDERGLAHFLGRGDSQVKSRGYRIELGEIEAALNTAPGVHESAVVAVGTDGFEGAEICGAYVPHAGSGVTPASLRRHLQRMVPAYMVPSRWLAVDGLPRTGNGKTDRRELRKMFERGSSVAAHTA